MIGTMKTFLFSLVLSGAAFAQDVKLYAFHMDAPACIRQEIVVGMKGCVQNVFAAALSADRNVSGFEITIEYTDKYGARRSQVAYVKANWQDAAMVGSFFFYDVDDITDLKASVVPQVAQVRAVRR